MLTRRKALARSALCLLLGGVLTWLVAAAFAIWSPKPGKQFHGSLSPPSPDAAGPFVARVRRWGIGFERRGTGVINEDWTDMRGSAEALRQSFGRGNQHPPRVGNWGRWPTLSDEDLLGQQLQGEEDGFGWPCLAFWFPVDASYQPPFAGPGGLDLMPITGNKDHWNRAIPLLPIWPGFLLDTGFYAALWALPLFGLPLLRQTRRKRKGRCPNCAYDLKRDFEQGCPECGWRRAGNARAS